MDVVTFDLDFVSDESVDLGGIFLFRSTDCCFMIDGSDRLFLVSVVVVNFMGDVNAEEFVAEVVASLDFEATIGVVEGSESEEIVRLDFRDFLGEDVSFGGVASISTFFAVVAVGQGIIE